MSDLSSAIIPHEVTAIDISMLTSAHNVQSGENAMEIKK
jgi:hypothetical protein